MTVEITHANTIEPTYIAGDFGAFVNEMQLAAAAGKRFVILTERRPDGSTGAVALDTGNMTRMRDMEDMRDAFVGM